MHINSLKMINNPLNPHTLINVLCKQQKGLILVHFNARSLNNDKLDLMRYIFEKSLVDIICVTETWFCNDISDSIYDLSNYNLLRNDRVAKRGGGVAIYSKKYLTAKLISKSVDSVVEYINISVEDNFQKVLVSCVYNPNKNHSLDPFFSEISSIIIEYDHFLVCGDFNINMLRQDSNSINLSDQVSSVGLSFVNTLIPTRFCNNSTPSLLDIILVSNLSLVLFFDQITFVSDHDLLFCTFDIEFNRVDCQTSFSYYDYHGIVMSELVTDAMLVDWSCCWNSVCVDEKLAYFVSAVKGLFSRHVPMRTVKKNSNCCPWINYRVISAIKLRNKLHSKWKANPTLQNWQNFKTARNSATSLTRLSKQKYFEHNLNVNLPAKKLWQNIRNNVTGRPNMRECDIDPNLLNEFFTATLNNQYTTQENVPLLSEHNHNTFSFQHVTERDLSNALFSIKSNAVGIDGISIKFLKIIFPFISAPLTHILNHSFTTSCFPNDWKIAEVLPIPKITRPQSPSDFRPISVLTSFSKIFEILITKQIRNHLEAKSLLNPYQSGFRRNHSCSTAMVKILDDIRLKFDKGEITLLCLLDFSKAFDSVNHKLLCHKLTTQFHFDHSSSKFIANYLSGRSQRVKVGNSLSSFRHIDAGVPQGSVLGPLLFSMFINDVFSVCKNSSIHAYADDIQLYLSRPLGLIEDLAARINEDLHNIFVWSVDNKLTLNAKKSYVLPISKISMNNLLFPSIQIGHSSLQFVSKIKNLGFYINSSMTAVDHINSVVKRVYLTLRNLRLSAYYTPINTKKKLIRTLIIPIICYSEVVYSKLDAASMQKLNVAINNATRYVFGLRTEP